MLEKRVHIETQAEVDARRIAELENLLAEVTQFLAYRRSAHSGGWWNDRPLSKMVKKVEGALGRRVVFD